MVVFSKYFLYGFMSASWKGTNICSNLVRSCSFLLPRLLKGNKYMEVLKIFVRFPQMRCWTNIIATRIQSHRGGNAEYALQIGYCFSDILKLSRYLNNFLRKVRKNRKVCFKFLSFFSSFIFTMTLFFASWTWRQVILISRLDSVLTLVHGTT